MRRTVSRADRGARPTGSMNTESVLQLLDEHESLLSDLGAASADESRACAPLSLALCRASLASAALEIEVRDREPSGLQP